MNGIYMLVNGIAQYLSNRQINQHAVLNCILYLYLRTIRTHNTVTQTMLPQFFFDKNSTVSNEVIAAQQ